MNERVYCIIVTLENVYYIRNSTNRHTCPNVTRNVYNIIVFEKRDKNINLIKTEMLGTAKNYVSPKRNVISRLHKL